MFPQKAFTLTASLVLFHICEGLRQRREVPERVLVPKDEHDFQVIKTYPRVQHCNIDRKTNSSKVCGPGDRFPPVLVANNESELNMYQNIMCSESPGYEFPQLDIKVAVTQVKGACMYMPSRTENWGMYREVWNSTHSMLLGDSRGVTFKNESLRSQSFPRNVIHADDFMVVPYAHFDSLFQHALLDFLPQAFAVFDYVKEHNLRILVKSKPQQEYLKLAGLDPAYISEMGLGGTQEQAVFCVDADHSIHVVEVLGDGMHNYYHRMLSTRPGLGEAIGKEILARDVRGTLRDVTPSKKPAVTFMSRCKAKARHVANEDEALELVRRVMKEKGREEELVEFCGNNLTVEEQVAIVRRSKLVLGVHGGALANLLFAKPSCNTRVIEFVGHAKDSASHLAYKSYYYFGMGGPFTYMKVLFGPGEKGLGFRINLEDLELALNTIWN